MSVSLEPPHYYQHLYYQPSMDSTEKSPDASNEDGSQPINNEIQTNSDAHPPTQFGDGLKVVDFPVVTSNSQNVEVPASTSIDEAFVAPIISLESPKDNATLGSNSSDEPKVPPIAEPNTESYTELRLDPSTDPNTSTLFPQSSGQQFATPLKSLPSLKDIEPITTPKSFSVARDGVSALDVVSSPVVHHKSTILENLAEVNEGDFDGEADDTFAENSRPNATTDKASELGIVASFLGAEPQELLSIDSELLSKICHRSRQYQGAVSELSFFKLNQELILQVHQKKLEMLQKKIDKLSQSNSTLLSDNESLTTDVTTKEGAVSALRKENTILADKVFKLEASISDGDNRHSVLLASKDQEIFHLNESINKIAKSNVELGQRLSELTKELSETTNEKFNLKLELSKATNQLSYTTNQKEWYELELRTVQDRLTALIKTHETDYLKNSNLISSLTNEKENLSSLRDSLQAQVKEFLANYEAENAKVSALESKLDIQKIKFSRDSSAKDDTIELLTLQLNERDERIAQLEGYAEDLKTSTAESIGNLQTELTEKEEAVIILEERLRRTEDALDSELHKETELPKLDHSAELIMQTNPQGISLSALYTEFNHLKKELVLEKSQKEKLASQLQHFIAELESKKPAIANYRNQIQFYELSMKDVLGQMESLRIDKVEGEKEINRLRVRLTTYETELQTLKRLSKDLGKQLCYYLIHSKIREGNDDPLTSGEKKIIDRILAKSGNKNAAPETDTDLLISERLLGFSSVVELQKKNEELLMAVRLFGKQLEEKENESTGFESAAVEEAREAILTLQGELESVSVKLDATTKERDLLKGINQVSSSTDTGSVEIRLLSESNMDLKKRIELSEASLKDLQKQSSERIRSLSEKLSESNNSREELQLKIASVKHSVELAEGRLDNTKKLLSNSNREIEHFKKEAAFWKDQASKQEELLVKKSNELRDIERSLILTDATAKNLAVEKDSWLSSQASLRDEIQHLKTDKEHLNTFVLNLQSLLKEREASTADLSNKLGQSVENYQQLQASISDKEERIQILSSQSEMALKAQNSKLEQVNELSQTLMDTRSKLAEKQALIDNLKKQISTRTSQSSRAYSIDTSVKDVNDGRMILSTEYEDLKKDLRLAEAQISEFSNIAKAAENALMAANKSYDDYRADTDERLKLLLTERDSLSAQISSQSATINSLQKNLQESEDKFTNEAQELKSKLHEFSLKAGSYDDLQKNFETKLSVVKEDLDSQIKINSELQKNYESKLTECDHLRIEITLEKQKSENLVNETHLMKTQLTSAEERLKASESRLLESQSSGKEELNALKVKLNDLQYQYSLALNQLELNNSNPISTGSHDDEDLREVIGYLRREKEAAEVKVLALSDEQSRLTAQIESLSSELSASKSQLSRLQTVKIQLEDSTKDHSRLMEQLEQLNILRESNTTLRNENRTAIEKITLLESELAHMRSNNIGTELNVETDSAVRDQEVKLLTEENNRLKNQLNNNEELQNLMQRFENLKNEFKTKLLGHRNKNKELEKLLADARNSLETSQKELELARKSLETNNSSDESNDLKAQLKKTEAAIAEREQKFNRELSGLKETYEKEKTLLQTDLRNKYEKKLQDISSNSNDEKSQSEEEIRKQVEREYDAKSKEAIKQLAEKHEKDINSKVEEQVRAKLAQENTLDALVEDTRARLIKEYEDKIKKLNADFEQQLEDQKVSVTKQVDKKYEFKLRVLNRKVEKLEKEQQQGDSMKATSPALSTITGAPLGHQFTESTLSVIRPANANGSNPTVSTKPTQAPNQGKSNNQGENKNNRKRAINDSKGQNNKRSKE